MKKKNEIETKVNREISTLNITADDIKKYFCPKATDKELFLALGVIQSLNLNPHTREVHLVKYRDTDKLSIIVGYEVYLKRAERSGNLDGWESGISDDKKKAWVNGKENEHAPRKVSRLLFTGKLNYQNLIRNKRLGKQCQHSWQRKLL